MKVAQILPFALLPMAFARPLPLVSLDFLGSLPAIFDHANLEQITDKLLYNSTIYEFESAHVNATMAAFQPDTHNLASLDWDTGNCSKYISEFSFVLSCQRRVFGFHSYAQQKRLNKKSQEAIDEQYLRDMMGETGCELRGRQEGSTRARRVHRFTI